MGCDIHTHVEFYHEGTKTWKDGNRYYRNPYYDRDGDDEEEKRAFWVDELCGERNYGLFAILADVRNNSKVECICKPKGLPDDCNAYIKKCYEEWGADAHSASYFTLKELMKYYSDHRTITHGGMVNAEQAQRLDEFGETPTMWCGWTNASDFVFRTWSAESPLSQLIEALKQRAKRLFHIYDDERITEFAYKIRFVFWFDN